MYYDFMTSIELPDRLCYTSRRYDTVFQEGGTYDRQ